MSAWKLVEAVVESAPNSQQTEPKPSTAQADKNVGRKGKPSDKTQGRAHRPSSEPLTKEAVLCMASQQIERIFSEENLCMDTYIRSFMDESGSVPLSVVCTYQNVACFGIPVSDLIEYLQTIENSPFAIDQTFQTIKLKEKWEMWLMPNATGGRGAPLYSLQAGPFVVETPSLESSGEAAADISPPVPTVEVPATVLHMSALAKEFKPAGPVAVAATAQKE